MMTRAHKQQEVSVLAEKFARAKAAFLVDFKGLDVESVTALRKQLAPVKSEMRVVRNTLARRAVAEHEHINNALKDDFLGNNAVIFAFEDASEPAKVLKEFSKTNERLVVKSGYMDGQRLTEAKIGYLSTLPSKDVLRAQLLGTFASPMSTFVRLLNEVPSSFVRVLAAKKDQQGEG